MSAPLHVVVLAAGGARRYGVAKQLATLGGQPLVRRCVREALALPVAGVAVVLGARAPAVGEALRGLPLRLVVNPRWRDGLAGSLRVATATLPPGAGGALVLLADQVRVGRGQLLRLVRRWRAQPACVVAARYAGVLGVPAVFPAELFPALRRLRGDAGAKHLLRSPRVRVVSVEMPEAAFDVDRPGDVEHCGATGV